MARPRSGGKRMSKGWVSTNQSAGVIPTTSAGIVQSLSPVGDAFREDMTLLRTRGQILVTANADAAGDTDIIGLGIAILGPAELAAPPNPLTAARDDRWLWHYFCCLEAVTLTGGDPQAITTNERIQVDAKAMRKLQGGNSGRNILCLVAAEADGDFSSVTIISGLRFLLGYG